MLGRCRDCPLSWTMDGGFRKPKVAPVVSDAAREDDGEPPPSPAAAVCRAPPPVAAEVVVVASRLRFGRAKEMNQIWDAGL
ncbi:hypothetical protein Dimus_010403, partial [Dionaea muscipula]